MLMIRKFPKSSVTKSPRCGENVMDYREERANTIPELVTLVLDLKSRDDKIQYYFRGEGQDFGDTALCPFVYRDGYINNEDVIYREMQRFNDEEFAADKTVFDRLSRMQHYKAPTRLLDMSEDLMSSIYFAVENRDTPKKETNPVVYVFGVDKSKIKFYDSDAVAVVANLACIPLENKGNEKSKMHVYEDAKRHYGDKECFNKTQSVKFLLHEIKAEKHYFESIIHPEHIFSVFCVKPKYTNERIHWQKGAFLLFGLNIDAPKKHIQFRHYKDELTPIRSITKIVLGDDITLGKLKKLGITKPYIYPEMEKVAEHLEEEFKRK